MENLDDHDFDCEFAKEVEAEVKRISNQQQEEKEEEKAIKRLNKEITQKEVDKAINQLKNGKAAGIDRIIGEVMKEGGEMLRAAVGQMCCEAWRERVPADWMQGVIFHCTKKGTIETL